MNALLQRLVDRIQNEPAVFWGSVATAIVAIYHIVNPTGDKDQEITTLVTTLAPLIASLVIRSQVTPA